ncbi:MAG: methyltransferase domain-containing protein [Chloroflexi bacterium]|nr:MAG: methyltransferase domain-containing protein [Chloroflexota bacterium]
MQIAVKGLKLQNKLLTTTGSLAATLIGVNAPLPLIDLDKILTIVADTYNYTAPVDDEKQFNDSNLAEPLETFAQLLRKQHKQRAHVLALNCGTGWEANFLMARGFDLVGVDTSAEMLRRARSRVPGGKFLRMRMQNLQVPPEETFDAIWSTRTLIHVPQALVVDLLASWKRVLKPGGILGLGINVGERNSWEISEEMSGSPMLYHYFADGELEEALEAAGYQVVEKAHITGKSNSAESRNFFVFAQRTDASLDKTIYSQYAQYDEHEKRRTVRPEDLESAIALLLHTGVWLAMGQLHLKLAQYPQATSCLEQALRLQHDHFATLVCLSYAYAGLRNFDKAIATAHSAERPPEQSQVSDEERAELYHALGHFYIGRCLKGTNEASVQDREKGDYYMQLACSTGKNGYLYIGCLARIYNETKRFTETIQLFDTFVENEKTRADEKLENALYFYRAEASIGTDRYANARAHLAHVERYARANQDWDALAHVKLYQIRSELKRKNVGELSPDEIRSHLSTLYEHEPSPYVAESFRLDRENVISILSAFYLIKQSINEQAPPDNFDEILAEAIYYLEKMYERGEERSLNLLIFADNPGAVPGGLYKYNCGPQTFRFDEVGTDVTEREMHQFRVWAILALTGEVPASTLSAITFAIGRFSHEGYTIYIYDPKRVLPEFVRKSLNSFFVDSVEEIAQFTYINMLYDRARDYLSSTRGSSAIDITPSRQSSSNIDLLPIEGEVR